MVSIGFNPSVSKRHNLRRPYTAELDFKNGGIWMVGDAQPALVIGRHYITERDSAPVQYNGNV